MHSFYLHMVHISWAKAEAESDSKFTKTFVMITEMLGNSESVSWCEHIGIGLHLGKKMWALLSVYLLIYISRPLRIFISNFKFVLLNYKIVQEWKAFDHQLLKTYKEQILWYECEVEDKMRMYKLDDQIAVHCNN